MSRVLLLNVLWWGLYGVAPCICSSVSQDFLIDQKEFVEGIDWIGLNPTLPVYI